MPAARDVRERPHGGARAAVGGDLTVASFNVLNYFTTLGADHAGCTSFNDRTGDPVTVNSGCARRAAPGTRTTCSASRTRSSRRSTRSTPTSSGCSRSRTRASVDGVADEALATLVDALNADAGPDVWAYVPSSADLPPAAEMDVITNAIIYRPAAVERTGESRALGTESGDGEAFGNAREPIAQVFTPVGRRRAVPLRRQSLQVQGLRRSVAGRRRHRRRAGCIERVAGAAGHRAARLGADDPGRRRVRRARRRLQLLQAGGPAAGALRRRIHRRRTRSRPGSTRTRSSGLSGSLDHVLLNAAALERATGADIWEINAEESIALEYSRYNYHGTLFYAPDQYRSSDHDPVLVGLSAGVTSSTTTLTASPVTQVYGASGPRIQLTATVASAGPVSGSVEFVAGGAVIGTAPLENGAATYRLPATTPAGTYEIVARWAGTADVEGSTSAPVTVTVSKATTKTTLSALAGGRLLPTYVSCR